MPRHAGAPPIPGGAAQRATRIAFFIVGFAMAAWAPLVPLAKARAGLDDGALGLLLLCMGAGSIVAMPLAGMIARRFGCRAGLLFACPLACLALPLLATASGPAVLAAALFGFGAGVGTADCLVNIQAVIVERASARPMMSGFHGLFSLGAMAGAGGVSLLLGLGASPLLAMLCVGATLLAALAVATPHLLPYGGAGGGPAVALPHGIVLLIGVLCFILFLTEGSVLDWSAVFLTSERGVPPGYAGLGYAGFALAMTAGRFAGDAIVRRAGGYRVIVLGSIGAAFGLAMAVAVPWGWAGIAGYILVGAGCANIVPVLYTAVGRQRAMPEHLAVPAITSLGYLGILAGPAAIGIVARATSLPMAFLLVAALLLGVAAAGRRVVR